MKKSFEEGLVKRIMEIEKRGYVTISRKGMALIREGEEKYKEGDIKDIIIQSKEVKEWDAYNNWCDIREERKKAYRKQGTLIAEINHKWKCGSKGRGRTIEPGYELYLTGEQELALFRTKKRSITEGPFDTFLQNSKRIMLARYKGNKVVIKFPAKYNKNK